MILPLVIEFITISSMTQRASTQFANWARNFVADNPVLINRLSMHRTWNAVRDGMPGVSGTARSLAMLTFPQTNICLEVLMAVRLKQYCENGSSKSNPAIQTTSNFRITWPNFSKSIRNGNYMRKCASGGQSLANAERGVEMCGFVGKIDTEFFITNVYLYIIIGNPGPNILVAHFRM